MCMVSMVLDYGRRQWPDIPPSWPYSPKVPSPVVPSLPAPSPEDWARFMEIVRKAMEHDRATKQPDCEDPEKVDWMKRMERRIADLERAASAAPPRAIGIGAASALSAT